MNVACPSCPTCVISLNVKILQTDLAWAFCIFSQFYFLSDNNVVRDSDSFQDGLLEHTGSRPVKIDCDVSHMQDRHLRSTLVPIKRCLLPLTIAVCLCRLGQQQQGLKCLVLL